jgi:hypothetical protein
LKIKSHSRDLRAKNESGGYRGRTGDLRRAKAALSQLS